MMLTRITIENKVISTVLVALMLVAGTASYFSLPRAEDPGYTERIAYVTTFLPGARPELVEQLVTDHLEEAIESIEEVDFFESESRTGAAVIEVVIGDQYPDMTPIWDELRETVADAAPGLPAEAVGPFVNDDFGDVFSTVVVLTAEGFEWREMETTAERLRARLLGLPNVAKVEIVGVQPQRVFIEYDKARLADLGLSPSDLARQLQDRNILLAGGQIRTSGEQIEIGPGGSFTSLDDIRRMSVTLPSGELAALEDLARVVRGYEDPAVRQVSYRGQPALALGVSMTTNGKVSDLGPAVLNLLETERAQLPIGIDVHTVSYRTAIVDEKVSTFTGSLLQGMGAVLLVVLLVLGLRSGLVVASVIPLTMVGSLLAMQYFGVSLNQMSLTGLIIALGLLVDSGVVVAESIVVRIREGESPLDAALSSTRELAFPLLVGAGTTVLALLPNYIAEHQAAEYTSSIFETVTIALGISWVLALTILPMIAVTVLSQKRNGAEAETEGDDESAIEKHAPGEYDTAFYAFYRRFLLQTLRYRWVALSGLGVLFLIAIYCIQYVPQNFFPRKEETLFVTAIDMPYGTPMNQTMEVVRDLERFMDDSLDARLVRPADGLRAVPETDNLPVEQDGILNWAAFVGQGALRYNLGYAPEQPRENYAYLLINATTFDVQDRLVPRIERFLGERHPEAIARVEKLRNGPPLDYPIEVRISGEDPRVLFGIADQAKQHLTAIDGVVNVSDNWGRRIKRLDVAINDDRARRAGLTARDVAVSMQAHTSGVPLTQFREGDDLIPIVLRSTEAAEDGAGKLDALDIFSQRSGQSVPLRQVADLDLAFAYSKILRRDRERTIAVRADLASDAGRGVTAVSVQESLQQALNADKRTWPTAYSFEMGGEPEQSGEAGRAIGAKFPIAALLILLLLVVEFNSIRKPLIILLTLPFALIGVVIGLLLTQLPLGFMAQLGIIALFGIVINNAVVLLDRIDTEIRDAGRSPQDAVMESSQRRLRPILLTTATTVAGLLPLWFGGDVMFQPMAVAMIFGLVVSTVLTLGLVPILYALFFRVRFDEYVYAGISRDPSDTSASRAPASNMASRNGSMWAQLRRWVSERTGGL